MLAACARMHPEVPARLMLPAIRAAVAQMRAGTRKPCGPERLVEVLWGEAPPVPAMMPVINATGVLLHTNLGRAPIGPGLAHRLLERVQGYCSLEYDVLQGARGSRTAAIEARLRALFGVEGALAVNNNAAAMLLVVAGLARGGEVIVSRGELVQIGGGFRVPDVLLEGGARLREVGTTNQTTMADYAAAVGPDTRMLLKVHASNFRQLGFVAEASLTELAVLKTKYSVPLVHDLGSGAVADTRRWGFAPEPTVSASLAAGTDLVAFSGDKLFGGAQAGLIVGRADLIDRLRRHPLARAMRLGKLEIALLELALDAHLEHRADTDLGLTQLVHATTASLAQRCDRIIARLHGWRVVHCVVRSALGGGSLPGAERDDPGLAVLVKDPDAVALALRAQPRPVIVRVVDGKVVVNLRTVRPDEDDLLIAAFAGARRTGAEPADKGEES